jgi:hypothetical protein
MQQGSAQTLDRVRWVSSVYQRLVAQAGRIGAAPTYQLIKDEFVCEPKGTIKIKGADQLESWHVPGKKAA